MAGSTRGKSTTLYQNYCMVKNDANLRSFIKAEMGLNGMDMNDLAEKSGVARSKISLYFKHKYVNFLKIKYKPGTYPSQLDILCMANLFGIKISLKITKNESNNAPSPQLSIDQGA